MYELVLGAQGVALHARVGTAVEEIEGSTGESAMLRTRSRPRNDGGFLLMIYLPQRAGIGEAIVAEERLYAATRQAEAIRTTTTFQGIRLPEFDIERIEALLQRALAALEVGALAHVQEHLATLGPRGEQRVATGMGFVAENEREDCPFSAQTLANSILVAQYRGYFSEEYARLKGEIAELLRLLERQHGGNTRATFERSVRIAQERRQFWHCASRSH